MGVDLITPPWANPTGDSPAPTDPNRGVPAQPAPWAGFGSQSPVQDAQTSLPLFSTVYIPATLKMTTYPSDAGLVLPRAAVRDPTALDLTKLVMWIRRRGQTAWLLAYVAWEFDEEGGLTFLFTEDFYELDYGRYECQLNYGVVFEALEDGPEGYTAGVVEVDYRPALPTRPQRPAALKRNVPTYPAPPEDISDMYDPYVTLNATLTAILEVGAQTLSLDGASHTLLLGYGEAKPMQLQISDGARTEIVEYAGPSASQVVVQRAMVDTRQYRFPIGSKLTFKWTAANVANAAADA